MPIHCVAWGCTNKMKKGSGISFHRFPHRNPQMLEKWIQVIRREKWHPNRHSYICSLHFEDSCFVVRPGKIGHRLYEHAVPSIFNFPEHLQKKTTKPSRKSPMKRKQLPPKQKRDSPSKVAKRIGMDHCYSTAETYTEKITKLAKQVRGYRENVR